MRFASSLNGEWYRTPRYWRANFISPLMMRRVENAACLTGDSEGAIPPWRSVNSGFSIRVSHAATWLVSIGRTREPPGSGGTTGKRPRNVFPGLAAAASHSQTGERPTICKVAEFPKLATRREAEKTAGRRPRTDLGIFSRANKPCAWMRIHAARDEMLSRSGKW